MLLLGVAVGLLPVGSRSLLDHCAAAARVAYFLLLPKQRRWTDKKATMQKDYASVAALSEDEQLQLFDAGDAPERLWAAWALALRHGRRVLPTLSALSDEALTEGLKRQLLVILAGLGARSVLLTIATSDPAPAVRATAVTYYIRTAGNAEYKAAVSFAVAQLHSGVPELVVAVLAEHEASRINLPDGEIIACLNHRHVEIRQAAVQGILSRNTASSLVRDSLLRMLVDEDFLPLREQLLDYLPRAELPLLVRFLNDAPTKRIVDVLDRLRQKFGPLSWYELSGLVSMPEPSVADALLRILDVPVPSEAIPWLGSTYVASMTAADRVWRDIQWRAKYSLQKSICAENVHLLGSEATTRLRKEIQDELAYFNSATVDELEENDYIEEDWVELNRLATLLAAAV